MNDYVDRSHMFKLLDISSKLYTISIFIIFNAQYSYVFNLLSCMLHHHKMQVAIVSSLCYLYGCEFWLLKLWEEHGLKLSENRVLRKIFGHKREEIT
jgi:hypothetical protein